MADEIFTGEYIKEAELSDEGRDRAHAAMCAILAESGVDPEQVSALAIVFRVKPSEAAPNGAFGYAGNVLDDPILLAKFLHLATAQLLEGMRDEAIAAMVPDDLSGLLGD